MRAIKVLLVLAVLAALAAGAWLWHFSGTPIAPAQVPFEFTVKPGSGVRNVARTLADGGYLREPYGLWILSRVTGRETIQAGTYRVDKPLTPLELLDKMARGDVILLDIRFIEGTTLKQWLAQIAAQPNIRHTLAGKGEAEVRAALGLDQPVEGWLFPDTYRFAPGVTDVEILKRAHAAMKKRLAEAWEARDPAVPLKTPYEALILASIVEKETGAGAERPLVASVFANRIRRGMRLQTDPTVIYGMGDAYDGNIRKRDLTTDTPWNTYTRDGLPPTPIAMPGGASLTAATRPAQSEYLYFVGKGDGTHQFSRTLEEHNRGVAKWQLKR
jgi:UPF0755 protein